MEIPDTLGSFLKPLPFIQQVDEKQLPPNLSRQLDSIVSHYQNKRGNIILFTDGSSMKNALASSMLADQLGQDVYQLDLSAAASSHLGETEKHLLQIFEFADEHGLALLFDEADSLFGKRTAVNDSHDRYANLEIAYLLRRIENFSGMVILTTNLRENLDSELLKAVPWQISLTDATSPQHQSWRQRLFG